MYSCLCKCQCFIQTSSSISFLCVGGSVPLHPVLTGNDMAYLKASVVFHCVVPNSSLPATYELIKDGRYLIGKQPNIPGNKTASFYQKVTATSEGSYNCKAKTREGVGISNSIRLSVVSEYQTHRESIHHDYFT